jgi:hypothetical protein
MDPPSQVRVSDGFRKYPFSPLSCWTLYSAMMYWVSAEFDAFMDGKC